MMVRSEARTQPVLDVAELAQAAELLRALSAPHRLAIVLELAVQPRCVHELVSALGISQSLASQHLRVLRSARLVTGARRGKETLYTLADDHISHIARDAVIHGTEPRRRNQPEFTSITATREEHEP
jgi:DNA-binding transcriptional ArsR family regulator